MSELTKITDNLKLKPSVDSVFVTGSQGSEHKPYSDIDLVIILNKHEHDLTSLYTWIDGKFADIFFYDHSDLERIKNAKELPGNAMDAIFVSWLEKATIVFDKSGKLTELKNSVSELSKKAAIPKSEKELFWQRINYNLVANTRYFESNDPVYHEALEVRLLYSVSEIFTGYFEFRDILWRGEKTAIKYLKENDTAFYNTFIEYTKASNLSDKFKIYCDLVKLVFPETYKLWSVGDVLPQSRGHTKEDMVMLVEYWQKLVTEHLPYTYRRDVSTLIINKYNEFLLVNLESFEDRYFAVPGGGVELTDSLEDAAYREIREELGITRNSLEFIAMSDLPVRFRFKTIELQRDGKKYDGSERYFFAFRFIGNADEITPKQGEVRSYRWVPFSGLKNYLLFDGQLHDTVGKISELFPHLS